MSMNSNSVIVGFLRSSAWRKLYAARESLRSGLSDGRVMGSIAAAIRPDASAADVGRNWRRESVIRKTPGGWEGCHIVPECEVAGKRRPVNNEPLFTIQNSP